MGPIVTAASAAALPLGAVIVHVESDAITAEARFAEGHIPDARLAVRDALTARSSEEGDGRHPLPAPEVFAQGLAALGIGHDDTVLAYDREGGASAARLVYLLRILGQPAAVLDGGLAGYTDALQTGPPPEPEPVVRRAVPWPQDRLVDADEVQAHLDDGGVVIDARASERYRGEVEPLDPVAGHIPGALNRPFTDNLDREGLFRAPPKLHADFTALGVDADAIIYCGSGVTACHDLLAAEHAGLGLPRLYVGSWSQWCRDETRPRSHA